MGLFSPSKTYVATQYQRVIKDELLPNSVLTGITNNLFDAEGGNDQMVENIMEEMIGSIGIRGSRMFNYGDDGYMYGLPESSYHSSQAGRDAVAAAIAAERGTSIQLSYYHFGRVNSLHLAWQKLVADHGWNSETNEITGLTTVKGFPVYLKDMYAVVVDASSDEITNGCLDVWGPAANSGKTPESLFTNVSVLAKPTPFKLDAAASNDYAVVDYCWEETYEEMIGTILTKRKRMKYESMTLQITGFDSTENYHQARYTANGKVAYWTYKEGTGAKPAVDKVFDTVYAGTGTFFPIGYLRYNKTQPSLDKTSTEYKNCKKLFKYLNANYDVLVSNTNKNPDIADVESALVMMLVPATSTQEIDHRYLFDFFSSIYTETQFVGNTSKLPISNNLFEKVAKFGVARTSIVIQDKRFKMAISYSSIIKSRVVGKIGKIGTYTGGSNDFSNMHNVTTTDGKTFTTMVINQHFEYKHQITEEMYEMVQVYDLETKNWIWNEYTTTFDDDSNDIMIPVDVNITKRYSIPDREKLYSRSLHYVFNSRQVVHLKWYQRGIFKAVVEIIMIIIAVVSYQYELLTLYEAIIEGGLTVAMVQAAIMFLIKYLLVQFLVKLFVRKVGVKIAFIVAVIAALAGMYDVYDAGGIQGAPWANQLLQLSSGITSSISTELKDEFNQLQGEYRTFQEYAKTQNDKIKTAEELLNGTTRLSPFVIFGESPDDFYQRTVHSGNIGVMGIEAVTSYVDIALTLPKLSTTLGEQNV